MPRSYLSPLASSVNPLRQWSTATDLPSCRPWFHLDFFQHKDQLKAAPEYKYESEWRKR